MSRNNFLIFIVLSIFTSVSLWSMNQNHQINDQQKCFILEPDEGKILLANSQQSIPIDKMQRQIIYNQNNNYRDLLISNIDYQNKGLINNNKDSADSGYYLNQFDISIYNSYLQQGQYQYLNQINIPANNNHLQANQNSYYYDQNQVGMSIDNSYLQQGQYQYYLNQINIPMNNSYLQANYNSLKKNSKLKLAYQSQYLDFNPNSEYVFSEEEKEQIRKLISKSKLNNNDLKNLNLWVYSKLSKKDLPFLMNLLGNFVSKTSFIKSIKEEDHAGIIYLLKGVPFNIVNIVNLSGEPLKHAESLGKSKNEILKEYEKDGDYQIILNVLKSYKFFVKFHSKSASIVYDPNNHGDSCFIFNENENENENKNEKIILVDNPHRQYFLPEYDSEYKVSAKEIKDVFEKAQFCNKDIEILKLWIDSKLDKNDLDNLLILLKKFITRIKWFTYSLNEKNQDDLVYLFKGVLVNIAYIISSSNNSNNHGNKPLKSIWSIGARRKDENNKTIDGILENYKFFIKKYNNKSYIIYNINGEKDEYFIEQIDKEIKNKKHEITLIDNPQVKANRCVIDQTNEESINKKPTINKRKADESSLEEHPSKKHKTSAGITEFRIADRYLKQKGLKYYLFSENASSEQANEALGEASYRFLSLAQLDEQLKLKTSLNINLVKSSLYYDTDIAVELLYTGAEYSPATDFLSVVMAGRGLNGFVPHLEMNSFIVLVLSPKQYKDDKESYDLLLQQGYRLLLIHTLTTGLGQLKREELGLVTSRRIASLFLAQRLNAPNFMMLDDNLDGIFLSPNISNIKDSFINIFGLLKDAAKNNDLSLLSIRSYGDHLDSGHPAASELTVEKEAAGSKLFYFDLSKLNEKQILKDAMWFFPPLVNIWGEDLFWHLALRQLELSVGVVNRLAMVLTRQYSDPNACLISLGDGLGEAWLENKSLKEYFAKVKDRDLKGIYRTMQRIVKKNVQQRIKEQEQIASLDLSQQTAAAAQKLDEWEKYPEWSLGPAIDQEYQSIDLAAQLLASTLPSLLQGNGLDSLFAHQHEALMTFVPKNNPPEMKGYVEMATGSGKSLIINKLLEALLKDLPNGSNIALLLPTRELVDQAYESIIEYNNQQRLYINLKQVIAVDSHHIRQAYLPVNRKLNNGGYLIIFCNNSFSKQLADKKNTSLVNNLKAILVDELHEAREDLLNSLVALQKERGTLLYGFSATPGAKAQYFDKQLYEYSCERGVKENILAPWQTHIIGKSSFKDINNKKITMPSAVKKPKAFANFLQNADIYGDGTSLLKKKGLIFVPRRAKNQVSSYAQNLVSSLKASLINKDIEIAEVSSDTLNENKNTINRFKDPNQNTNILVVVDMLNIGFNGDIGYVVIDRNTTNKDKLIQIFGRALRKGKNGKVAQIFLQEGTYHRFKEIVLPPPVPMLPEKKYEDDMPMSDQIYYPEQNYGGELYQ